MCINVQGRNTPQKKVPQQTLPPEETNNANDNMFDINLSNNDDDNDKILVGELLAERIRRAGTLGLSLLPDPADGLRGIIINVINILLVYYSKYYCCLH